MVPAAFGTRGRWQLPKKLLQKKLPGRASRRRPRRALCRTPPPSHPSRSKELARSAATGGDDSEHGDTSENKKKKKKKKEKKEQKSAATAASDLEADETEEQQEKCQRAKKWKHELQALVQYRESHNIFLHNLPPRGGSSHIGYLESRITEADSGFFIKSIKVWWHELETQSQGVEQNTDGARRRLLILESKAKERLSTMYNVQAKYLV